MSAKKNIFYRTFQLLSPEPRRKGLVVTFLLVTSSLLDFFSLASFLPLILLVVNPGLIQTSSLLQGAYHFFGFTNSASLGITLTLLVLLFIVLKIRINQWIAYRKASYAYGVRNEMASLAIRVYSLLKKLDRNVRGSYPFDRWADHIIATFQFNGHENLR